MQNVISIAGYSPQLIGMDIRSQVESEMELHIREQKDYTARSGKENVWKAPLERILTGLLHPDSGVFGSWFEGARVPVLFSDSIVRDSTTAARTVNRILSGPGSR